MRSENRIDQRMPLEFVTDSFLPSETSARSCRFKKTLLLESKTIWQRMGQDKRSEPDMLFAYRVQVCGRAVLFNGTGYFLRHVPGHAFLFNLFALGGLS